MDRRDVPASAITYREWLVGQAVAALAARLYPTRDADSLPPDFLADSAVEMADAVLARLARDEPPPPNVPPGADPFGHDARVTDDDGEVD